MPARSSSSKSTGYNFGAFQGVFTPSILTILGVIMFLRFGWVLGNVGLPLTLLIVTISTSITLLTGLSLSATATNMKVGGGGAYFLISRSLGPEVGAAIGLPLFMAQALGIAFYISGFSEAVVDVVDLAPWLEMLPGPLADLSEGRLIAVITLIVLTILATISASLALKTQLFILAAIFMALVSFFTGGAPDQNYVLPGVEVPDKLGFWVVFAVFFPAVTGIEAGIAMSGDLENPAKSLPKGTIAAVLTGYAVYMIIPVFLVYIIRDEQILLTRPLIMQEVARWGTLILVGVWAATLSSALGALLGAPRTLQALSRDTILPKWVGRGFGASNDPRIATLLSFVLALAAILLGDLNVIAPVLSMFFLTSYGLINLSAGLEGLIESPTWRPQFRFPWWGSLIGAAACFITMLMINLGATFAALLITGSLYAIMKHRQIRANWGDTRQGILMLLVRFAIRRLVSRPADERNWRPNVLVFTGSPQTRWHLVEVASAVARGTSYLTLAAIVPPASWAAERASSLRQTIQDYLERRGVSAMIKLYPSDDVFVGMETLVSGYGFGPLVPNTIVLGETEQAAHLVPFGNLVKRVHSLDRNLVLVRDVAPPEALPTLPRIDLWWSGQQLNIGLMLALAFQMTKGGRWAKARIVMKRLIRNEAERNEIQKFLLSYQEEHRLDLEVEILIQEDPNPFDLIRRSSSDASLVLMGMKHPEKEESAAEYAEYYQSIMKSTQDLPLVLVLSAENVDFREIIGLG